MNIIVTVGTITNFTGQFWLPSKHSKQQKLDIKTSPTNEPMQGRGVRLKVKVFMFETQV
jgi:hypothetical protein